MRTFGDPMKWYETKLNRKLNPIFNHMWPLVALVGFLLSSLKSLQLILMIRGLDFAYIEQVVLSLWVFAFSKSFLVWLLYPMMWACVLSSPTGVWLLLAFCFVFRPYGHTMVLELPLNNYLTKKKSHSSSTSLPLSVFKKNIEAIKSPAYTNGPFLFRPIYT